MQDYGNRLGTMCLDNEHDEFTGNCVSYLFTERPDSGGSDTSDLADLRLGEIHKGKKALGRIHDV